MKCCRTYEWDGLDGGQTIIDKENSMLPVPKSPDAPEEDDDEEHMQRFKPKSPPMLYAAMFNKK